MKSQEYKSSFEDEIDWKIIEQLHSATARFSSASTELKKMCLILIGITIPAIIKLSNDKLDFSLFVTLYILIFTFWYLDSYTYYHQENLREKMDKRFKRLKKRNSVKNEIDYNEEFTLEDTRTKVDRWKRALKNSSVRMYHVFLVLNTFTLILFLFKAIK
ncbi:hypothetical protein [Tenacibaculum aiptasiae]|uniref:hypothetical protein n=1 Tax=Tenacibaculum aiptasiae TaxID=426481 RepID=UPI00232C655F|nr:hypothetical protein [Tenacibaculum aiptasiae]